MKHRLRRGSGPRSLIARLIDSPELGRMLRALPAPAFSRLVQEVGVEDAAELVAHATTEQLVRAFDEDLFRSDRPGEREALDVKRFATWLEVLLEAGDDVAARRVSELSEDFVALALNGLLIVLDSDLLRARMGDGGDDAERADKAIESALSEEIDGYLLVARQPDGWDAALALVLALDRDHRALLERLLDRCAAISAELCDDLGALGDVLSEGATLAEDVEAEREARRSRDGFVEPRAARSFLTLARTGQGGAQRDAITQAYFRELAPVAVPETAFPPGTLRLLAAVARLSEDGEHAGTEGPPHDKRRAAAEAPVPFAEAMRALREHDVRAFTARTEELTYLASVLVAAGTADDARPLRPAEAAEAALATVALGAELEASGDRSPGRRVHRARVAALMAVLGRRSADALFRVASARLAGSGDARFTRGYLLARAEVAAALAAVRKRPRAHPKA